MVEDQNRSVEEVAPQDPKLDASAVADSTAQTPAETPSVAETHEADTKQERNWNEVRRKQRESNAKIEAQQEVIELLKQQMKSPTQESKPDKFADVDPEDYPTWGQVNEKFTKDTESIVKDTYRKLEAEKNKARFHERLQKEFEDFDSVVNPESLALLEEKKPKLAASIAEHKDPYVMGLQAYHYLQAMNLSSDVSGKRHAKEVEKKLEQNENTVQSPQAYNKRPMAQAFQYSEADSSKLYEEMMGCAAKSGFGY